MTQLQTNEEYRYLVEDCQAALIEGWKAWKETQTKTMWALGETITNHPAYHRHAKGNKDFIMNLANDIKGGSKIPLSDTTIYNCLDIYKKFPNVSTLLDSLGAQPTWGRAVKLLGNPKKEKEIKCKNCPQHCS